MPIENDDASARAPSHVGAAERPDEAGVLAASRALDVLDSEPEPEAEFDALARAAATAGGGIFRAQLPMVGKSGAPLWIDASGVRLTDDPLELMYVLTDISVLKEAEEVRVRGIALEAQNQRLRETGRLKDEFLANMSHELRTPLNAVIGFSQLLSSGLLPPDSPKHVSFLREIETSGRHLLELIETMLDYSRLVSGSVTFHPTHVHVPSAVEDVVTALAPKARSRGIDVRLELSDERMDVVVDPRRFRQVLINFLRNALKFSHEGGVVHVRTHPDGPLGLRVEIEDHGIGIVEADLPNLFSQFSQLSSGNTKIYEGTGLGLALVRRLVESQGGEVGVRSTLGVGSVFHFTLPGDAAASQLA